MVLTKRTRVLLVLGGVLTLIATGVVIGILFRSTNAPRVTASASPHESFIHLATDTMAAAGGEWTFDDKKTPFSLRKARKDKPEECLSDSSAEQYSLTLYGPATNTPSETIKSMTRHWQALDYSVRTVVDTDDAIEIAAAVPDGSEIGYFASTGTTSITVQGPCVEAAPTSTTNALQEEFLENVSKSVSTAGGSWTFENKKTPFSVARARTHSAAECLSDSRMEQYDLVLYGDAPADPRAASDAMASQWSKRGFTVTTVVDNSDGIEIRADTPDGSLLDFAVSPELSSLLFQSACTRSVG